MESDLAWEWSHLKSLKAGASGLTDPQTNKIEPPAEWYQTESCPEKLGTFIT